MNGAILQIEVTPDYTPVLALKHPFFMGLLTQF